MHKSIIDDARAQQSEFSAEERSRYSRHLIMPEVTLAGQKAA
jgi:adenylyltransferase/sulfurtransferase